MAVYEEYDEAYIIQDERFAQKQITNCKRVVENYVPGLYAIQVDNRLTAKEAREEDAN